MPENSIAKVRWGPTPDAPPIVALQYGQDETTGEPVEPAALAVVRQQLAQVAFHYGVLRPGQDPEREQGWKPAAEGWMNTISVPARLEEYANSVVDLAYADHLKWTEQRTDEIIGLPNRRRWLEDVVQAYKWVNEQPSQTDGRAGQRNERALLLCFADLDGFKSVNDEKGHEAGNVGLALFGGLFARLGRREGRQGVSSDLVARLHGDEFVSNRRLITTDVSTAAMKIAGRLQSALHAEVPAINSELAKLPNKPLRKAGAPSNYRPHLSASVGFALLRRGDSREDFIERADAAMYAAKEGRKDRVAAAEVRGLSDEDKLYLREAARILEGLPGQRSTYQAMQRLARAIESGPRG